jgi:hypothetical protein
MHTQLPVKNQREKFIIREKEFLFDFLGVYGVFIEHFFL